MRAARAAANGRRTPRSKTFRIKVISMGDMGAGKSCLIKRCVGCDPRPPLFRPGGQEAADRRRSCRRELSAPHRCCRRRSSSRLRRCRSLSAAPRRFWLAIPSCHTPQPRRSLASGSSSTAFRPLSLRCSR